MAKHKVSCLLTSWAAVILLFCFCRTGKSQDFSECGVSMGIRAKVIGGRKSHPGQWPWQVAINKTKYGAANKETQFHCGGALIDKRWVLTAAHCFYQLVYSWTSRIRYVEDSSYPHKYVVIAGGQAIQIAKILLHPRYRHRPFYENDIAIVELSQNVSLSSYVRTVCLPEENKKLSTPGSKIYVAGWGRTSNKTNNPSPVLLHASFKLQSNDLCRRATIHYFNELVTFCAGDGQGGSDTCQGDSGGSAVREVVRDGRRRWVAVGLVSWGEGCGIIGKYGYYTRMEPFLDWIKAITKRGCYSPRFTNSIPNPSLRPGQKSLHGTNITFSCRQQSYTLDGPSVISCLNGRWNGRVPGCKEGCQRPQRPDNGGIYREKDFYRHEDRIRYYCSNGYQRLGEEYSTCQNGQWRGQTPTCKRKCGNPGRPYNGNFRGSEFFEGREIRFYCYGGYDLFGSQITRCLPTGRWSGRRPECKRGCYSPRFTNSIPNPSLRPGQKSLHGTDITFSCRESYTLDGPSVISCLNGRWNGRVPGCKTSCSKPWDLPNGRKTGESYVHGHKVIYSCLESYTLVGSSSVTCSNGKWVLDRLNRWPSCKKSCQNPGVPSKGSKTGSDYRHGRRVFYTCERGTQMVGERSSTCQEGKWSNVRPACLKICQDPGNIVNGYKADKRQRYLSGDRVTYRCNPGYDLFGKAELLCNDEGQWNDKAPVCYGQCKVPNNFTGVQSWPPVNPKQSLKHKNIIRFYCDNGTQLVGTKKTTCKDGSWSKRFPTCQAVDCIDPGRIKNGGRYPEQIKYVFKDKVRFQCKTNYTLRGYSSITCQKDKSWSGNVPTCLAPCRDPGIPNHGSRQDHSFLHNARVRFSCQRGWKIEGSQTIRCDNGNWDHPTPQCLECGSALGMESGKIPDGNIQASSTRYRYHAKDGRLNGRYAWCSGSEREPYLQIDFGKPYKITGLATQGSAYNNKWVETYTVSSNLAGSAFNMYREDNQDKIFIGNRDKGTIVRKKLRDPFISRRLRIYPQKQGFSYACMRVEIYGCDLPSDCVMVGSRVVAKWVSYQGGATKTYLYYKAYLTSIRARYWKVELENENHGRPAQKYFPKYEDLPFVLDVPPKHEELQVGTRVLAPWAFRYYTSTIKTGRDRDDRYRVRADDGDENDFTIDQIRLLKAPTFCN